jgi:hypothetical protein
MQQSTSYFLIIIPMTTLHALSWWKIWLTGPITWTNEMTHLWIIYINQWYITLVLTGLPKIRLAREGKKRKIKFSSLISLLGLSLLSCVTVCSCCRQRQTLNSELFITCLKLWFVSMLSLHYQYGLIKMYDLWCYCKALNSWSIRGGGDILWV